MHEVAVVSDIVSAILGELEKYDAEKVEEVNLVVGEMTNLGTEQMEFAYEIVTRGTKLEGSRLNLEVEEVVVHCDKCGKDGDVDYLNSDYEEEHKIPILKCRYCGGPVTVVKGQSCRVSNIRIVEAD